jgi:hypothetical protein
MNLGWQLFVALTRINTVFRAWFGAATPFSRDIVLELFSPLSALSRLYFLD